MNLLEIIKSRRSIMPHLFNNLTITNEEINLILEAANWAPTHKKTEPWRFKVLKNKAKNDLGKFLAEKYKEENNKFSKFKYNNLIEKAKNSSIIILICMQRDPIKSIPEWEEIASVSMSVQNMWLMATSLNIGSYWSSPKLISSIGKFTPLGKGEKCLGIFYMGKYDEETISRNPGPIEKKVSWLN